MDTVSLTCETYYFRFMKVPREYKFTTNVPNEFQLGELYNLQRILYYDKFLDHLKT